MSFILIVFFISLIIMKFLLFISSFFTFFSLFAQRNCAFQHQYNDTFEEAIQHQILKQKNQRITEETIIIPVVVHIIHDNSNNTIGGLNNNNISEEQILSQIVVLNEDFQRNNADTTNTPNDFKNVAANTNIEFCLASRDPNGNPTNGITRTYSNKLPFNVDNDNKELKSLMYWNSEEYLNIWVTELYSDALGDILGYAQFPNQSSLLGLNANYGGAETDGIVIHHRCFGDRLGTASIGAYSYGRTATHEVGHWLGLLHIWGNSNSCNASDYCDDTPNQNAPTNGCPDQAETCGSMNMQSNYMDYTNDICMNIFTQDQKERMRAVLSVSPRRIALKSSLGCCGVKNSITIPSLEEFNNQNLTEQSWIVQNWQEESTYLTAQEGVSNILTSPHFNGQNISNPIIQFDIQGNLNENPLIILYETNCNASWDTLLVLNQNNYEDWNSLIFEVEELANERAIRLQFVTEGNIMIDNLQLYQKSDNLNFIVYPNPLEKRQLTIKTDLAGIHIIGIEIFNTIGALILKLENQEIVGSNFQINDLILPQGIYIIRIESNNETKVQQFIVQQE